MKWNRKVCDHHVFWLISRLCANPFRFEPDFGGNLSRYLVALFPHPSLWIFYLLAALLAGIAGIDGPARGAATRNLVRRELFPAASALNALLRQTGAVIGPALAGLIISYFNLSLAY